MVTHLFWDAIDYTKVRIHKGGLGGIPNRTGNAMTPRGEIYFPDNEYRDDFSISKTPAVKMWFVHEMAHVWQYQMGFNVAAGGIAIGISGGYLGKAPAYDYDLRGKDRNKIFAQFNMEQQADIICHYFAAVHLKLKDYVDILPELTRVLYLFIENPKDRTLLFRTVAWEPKGDEA